MKNIKNANRAKSGRTRKKQLDKTKTIIINEETSYKGKHLSKRETFNKALVNEKALADEKALLNEKALADKKAHEQRFYKRNILLRERPLSVPVKRRVK